MKCRILSDIYGHRTSAIWIAVIQKLLELAVSLTLLRTLKIALPNAVYRIEKKASFNCLRKEVWWHLKLPFSEDSTVLAVRWKQLTIREWRHVTRDVSRVAQLNSSVPWNIATPELPSGWHPKLPNPFHLILIALKKVSYTASSFYISAVAFSAIKPSPPTDSVPSLLS